MDEILLVEGITKRFGGLVALKDVSFSVAKGEIFGIIGPNGSGKTTLFNVISGLLKPDRGRILFMGRDITKLKPHERTKLGIARTFQNMRVYPYLPVYYNVAIAARAIYKDKKLAHAKTTWALTITGLLAEASELAGSLTPYKLRMLEIARALVTNPKVMLLDEPFAGLNPDEAEMMIGLIRDLNSQGITFLIIEHKLRYLMKLANRVMVLSSGEKICEGKPQEVVSNPKVIEVYIGRGFAYEGSHS